MTVFLVRHGETDWNREPARCQGWADVGLNQTGAEQALELGRGLAGRGVELVVTSHLRRALETAALVVDSIRTETGEAPPLITDPRLAETHRGRWETKLFSEIMATDPATWRAYREHPETFRFPGGERLADQQRRVLAAVRDAALDGRRVALVTHGGSIRLVRCFLNGRGVAAFHEADATDGGVDELESEGLAARIDDFLAAPVV